MYIDVKEMDKLSLAKYLNRCEWDGKDVVKYLNLCKGDGKVVIGKISKLMRRRWKGCHWYNI